MEKIVIVSCVSTGINFLNDIRYRGYMPVVVDVPFVGTMETVRPMQAMQESIYAGMSDDIPVIKDYADYDELVARVKEYEPILVLAGSEFGVPCATRLAYDLGLPCNPPERIPAMTRKAEMHKALKEYGIRFIEGRIINSVGDAMQFCDSIDADDFVVKWSRAAGTQGVHLCHGREQVAAAVGKALSDPFIDSGEKVDLLIQERIIGEEYIVNTVSRNGIHRAVSVWHYNKVEMPDGSYVYNYGETVNKLDIGASRMVRYAFDVLEAIGIKNGPVHGEYMIDARGPVLMEVNCRPMGGSMPREFLEGICGHHETDIILDTYLDPERIENDRNIQYRMKRKGAFKLFILPDATKAVTAPVIQIARRLRSYYKASFGWPGREVLLPQTTDMENAGGIVYLMHENEQVVMEDLALLHKLEMHYPKILFGDAEVPPHSNRTFADIAEVMKETCCRGTTLILTDRGTEVQGAVSADMAGLSRMFNGFEQGILDLTEPASYTDIESLTERIFLFADKIKEGGRIIIPESSYVNMPYGIDGMEAVLLVAGLRIEMPLAGDGRALIASVTEK